MLTDGRRTPESLVYYELKMLELIKYNVNTILEPDFYPPTKFEGYSYGVVCASFRPSILFVCPEPYISVPMCQILFILGINDLYHGLLISYKFR